MEYTECWFSNSCGSFPGGCKNSCPKFYIMREQLRLSNIDESEWRPFKLRAGKDKAAFIELVDIKKDLVNWVKQRNNLYIYSPSFGNGKTSWGKKLLMSYFEKLGPRAGFDRRGVFISVPEFFDRNRELINTADEEYIKLRQDLLTCDLVVWDDVGSTKLTDYNLSMLFNYMDARIGKKANIFTSNMDKNGLVQSLGERLADRIWGLSTRIKFVDGSKRDI